MPRKNQCEAMMTSSATGMRCRRDAVPEMTPKRCAEHHRILAMNKGANRYVGSSRTYDAQYMTRFYYRTLKPTLAARLEEALSESSPMEQLTTYEELALMRISAGDAVGLYSAAVEQGNTQAMMTAAVLMNDALKNVVNMAKDTAVLEDAKQKLNGAFAHVLNDVLQSVLRAASEAFGDDYRVKDFEKNLREHLEMRQFPLKTGEDGTEGTVLTPDQDARDMDSSIPGAPDDGTETLDPPADDSDA